MVENSGPLPAGPSEDKTHSSKDRPVTVTVGLPVFNGADEIEDTIRSAMAQRYDALEILIVDNASTDGTQALCEALAAEDDRIRYVRNHENIGQNPNFTRVFELASSDWLRWIGAGDTLEPGYVQACVEALRTKPDASVVTSLIKYRLGSGGEVVEEVDGRRPAQDDPIERLDAMLELLTKSPFQIDPIYSLVRRQALERSPLITSSRFADAVVACELALWGPYVHVSQVLASRDWAPAPQGTDAFRWTSRVGEKRASDIAHAAIQRPVMVKHVFDAIGRLDGAHPAIRLRSVWVLTKYVGRLIRRRVKRLTARVLPAGD